MKKMKLFSKTALFLSATIMLATSCSKEKAEEIEPLPKDFTELTAYEQEQILIKELNVRGGDYKLVGVTTYAPNGEVESGYNPEVCERAIVISVPDEIGKNKIMKQTAPDGACGRSYEDIIHNVVTLNFSNIKSAISFYTVQSSDDALGYLDVMYYDPKQNTDSNFLVLNSFRAEDLKSMTDGKSDVIGRRYKEFTFQKI